MAEDLNDEPTTSREAVTGPASLAAGPWLLLVATAALSASAILFIDNALAAHYAGYACASLIAFSAVAINRRAIVADVARVGSGGQRASVLVSALLLMLGLGLAIGHAWFIARHYG